MASINSNSVTTASTLSNPNNIFPNLRRKNRPFSGVNPETYLSPRVLKRAQNLRNKNKAATANRNANRLRLLNQYKSTSRKNRRTRKTRRNRRN
jgi:hypothetical protein